MATKTTTKKVTKKGLEPAYRYVISERSKLFSWAPIEVFTDYDACVARRRELEESSIYGGNGYKMTRVVNRD